MCNGLLKTYLLDLVFLDENLTALNWKAHRVKD